ncbi:MAG: UDP-3-O-(3-hydroxymyristoyl)glucosamine N-acyltransferase [Pseudomonadales bacterium]
MGYRLIDIAGYLEAELVSASGGSGVEEILIEGIADPESATAKHISFVSSVKYVKSAKSTGASALIVSPDLASSFDVPLLIVEDPYIAYARLSSKFAEARPAAGIHPSAVVSDSAEIGANVHVGENAVVLDDAVIADNAVIGACSVVGCRASIGSGTMLYPNVSLYHDVRIGKDCVIHAGTVIGSDGFGFAPTKSGYVKIHQLGTVVIGDNVEIGANVSIDRGSLGNTEVHSGAKIDNLVHIAHNCVIGSHTALAGQMGMAGSTKIGQRCSFGGQVGIAGHLDIGDDVHALGQARVTKSISTPGIYSSGTGTDEVKSWRKNAARFNHLDELFRRVNELEKLLDKKK